MKNDVKKIRVAGQTGYDVIIGSQILSDTGAYLRGLFSPCKVAVITDDIVDGLYSDALIQSLKAQGFEVIKYVFENGEKSKNIGLYAQILEFLAQNGMTRSDKIIALGGGVVGDLAGFVASTYLRGIAYVQIPTTLLAQIDSSVGGKTGVDLKEGKNLVGAIYRPCLVLCDIDLLNTLPNEVLACGKGELAKYAILDSAVYELVMNSATLKDLVFACVSYKAKIVDLDEREIGLRMLLNLGHTPAHAIERLSGYTISHGIAVAMGLEIILCVSKKRGYIDQTTFSKMKAVINALVGRVDCPYDLTAIIENMGSDKKRAGDDINLVLPHAVGDCQIEKIPFNRLIEYFL